MNQVHLIEIKKEVISRLLSEKIRQENDKLQTYTRQKKLDRKFEIEKEIKKQIEYVCNNSCVYLETEEDLLEAYQMIFDPYPEIKEILKILELDTEVAR